VRATAIPRCPTFNESRSPAACSRDLTRWCDYAKTVLAELDACPAVPLLAVIEGAAGGGEAIAQALEAASAHAWRHHWRVDSRAILPASGIWAIRLPRPR
jgi:hypothetical protein